MPERFDIAVLLESLDEKPIRAELVSRLRARLVRWIGAPSKFMLLGPDRDEHGPWTGEMSLGDFVLSDADQLSVYFDVLAGKGYVVLGIDRSSTAAVYSWSFPTDVLASRMPVTPALLLDIYSEIAAFGLRGVVAAGNELGLSSDGSIEAVLRSVGELGSLIELICFSRCDATELIGFSLVKERAAALVFGRDRLFGVK
jgi:hypothetical protein